MARIAKAAVRVQHARCLRRQRDQQQEGKHDASQMHRKFQLAGYRGKAGRQQPHQHRRKTHAQHTKRTYNYKDGRGNQVRQFARL